MSAIGVDAQAGNEAPAGIEYHGVAGASAECETAALRLLLAGPQLARALILTAGRDHALLLYTALGDPVAIKSGFASGYGGAGPTALSRVLQFLTSHDVDIDEIDVGQDVIERLDDAGLTRADLFAIENGRRVRPGRWGDYIREIEANAAHDRSLWRTLPQSMPYALLDPRLIDLALGFEVDPDGRLNRGYRRLEDIVRGRTGLTENGAKLFSKAFNGDAAHLSWKTPDPSEGQGRANLFGAVFMAYRNPRAHREGGRRDVLSEFLLLNELYKLEADAVDTSQ